MWLKSLRFFLIFLKPPFPLHIKSTLKSASLVLVGHDALFHSYLSKSHKLWSSTPIYKVHPSWLSIFSFCYPRLSKLAKQEGELSHCIFVNKLFISDIRMLKLRLKERWSRLSKLFLQKTRQLVLPSLFNIILNHQ
jgi:hypothetical protein